MQNELTRAQRLGKRIFPLLLEGDVWLALETDQYVDVRGAKLPPAALLQRVGGSAVSWPVTGGWHDQPAGAAADRAGRATAALRQPDSRIGRGGHGPGPCAGQRAEADVGGAQGGAGRQAGRSQRAHGADRAGAGRAGGECASCAGIGTESRSATRRCRQGRGQSRSRPSQVQAGASVKPAKPRRARCEAPPDLLIIDKPLRLELVRVPAGEFLMGSDPAKDKGAYDDEKPQHRLSLPEYYIGKYPVTNEQYAVFVEQTKGAAPESLARREDTSGEGAASGGQCVVARCQGVLRMGEQSNGRGLSTCRARRNGRRGRGGWMGGCIRGATRRQRAELCNLMAARSATRRRWIGIRRAPVHTVRWTWRATCGSGRAACGQI